MTTQNYEIDNDDMFFIDNEEGFDEEVPAFTTEEWEAFFAVHPEKRQSLKEAHLSNERCSCGCARLLHEWGSGECCACACDGFDSMDVGESTSFFDEGDE